jgi:hypothetical protein
MKRLLKFGLLWLATSAFAQTKLNLRLQRELDSMQVLDRKYRRLIAATRNGKADSVEATLHLAKGQLFTYALTHMLHVDSSNLRRVEVIMQRYGYPGKSLVGNPANEAAWYVIQHSNQIPKYLPQIKTAAEHGELPFWMYAQMLDRKLMDEGQPQLYGTQGASYNVHNKTTGQPETISFIWPVQDPAHANQRRRRAGFRNTLEKSSANMGMPYKPITLPYAKAVQQQAAAEVKASQQQAP